MRIAVAPEDLLSHARTATVRRRGGLASTDSEGGLSHTDLGLVGSPHLPDAVSAIVKDSLDAGQSLPVTMDVPEYRQPETTRIMGDIIRSINDGTPYALCISGRPGTGKTVTMVSAAAADAALRVWAHLPLASFCPFPVLDAGFTFFPCMFMVPLALRDGVHSNFTSRASFPVLCF